MADNQHTPEPWIEDGYFVESGYEGNDPSRIGTIADCRPFVGDSSSEAKANAHRLVVAVNACAGIDTATLEAVAAMRIPKLRLVELCVKAQAAAAAARGSAPA